MPELNALLLSEKYRASLLAGERASAVRLVNAYGMAYQRLLPRLDALDAEITRVLEKGQRGLAGAANLEATAKKLTALERQRIAYDQLVRMKRQITDEMGRYAVLVENEMDQGARAAIAAGLRDSEALTRAALPGVDELDGRIMGQWNRLNPEAVQSMLGFLGEGSPLRTGLRERYAPEIAQQVEDGLVEAITVGYNPRAVAAAFTQKMGMGLTSALRLSRTTQLYAYREATRAAYVANEDIVPGWTWSATKDDRTCMSCISMDGTEHSNKETLNDHWQGRCVMLPRPITYKALGLDVPDALDSDTWLKGLPEKEQMAMLGKRYPDWKSGDIRFSENARQWFERQPESVQREMMGKGKHEAFSAGAFGLEDMSTQVDDRIWGTMRVEQTLKALVGEGEQAA